MNCKDPQYWITRLGLNPHPEGGFYKRTFESDIMIPDNNLVEFHSTNAGRTGT